MVTKPKAKKSISKALKGDTQKQLDVADFLSINPGESRRLRRLLLKEEPELIAEPEGMKSDVLVGKEMSISPALANYFLRHGAKNRDSDAKRVAMYSNKMLQGEWIENPPHPQGLIFDKSGRLIDGKTRLLAVIKANKTIKFWVTLGAEDQVIRALDSGRTRSIAQTGQILGLGTSSMAVSITKALFIDPTPEATRIPQMRDPDKVFDTYRKFKEGIDFACRRYGGKRGGLGVASVRCLIARAYYRPGASHEALARYLEVLDTGLSESKLELNATMVKNFYNALPGRQGERGTLELHRKTMYSLDKFMRGEPISRLVQAKKQLFPLPDFD